MKTFFSLSFVRSQSRSFVYVAVFLILSIAPCADAYAKPSKRPAIPRLTADLRVAEMAAEKFSTGVRLVWRTDLERNVIGFRVWREEAGMRVQVGDEMIGGSLAKVRGGSLPTGDGYFALDPAGKDFSGYWLESIDVNSKSRWFGPVFAQPVVADDDNVAQLIAAYASRQPAAQSEFPDAVFGVTASPAKESINASSEQLAADSSALKMFISSRGIYRVMPQSLAEHGFDATQTTNWRLFSGGVEQPIKINDDGSIEFYGIGVDTLQTDANVYWLTSGAAAGQRIPRGSQNYQQSARDSSSRFIVERRERAMRLAGVINGPRENWFGSYVTNTPVSKTLDLRDIAFDSNQTATLGVDLQGFSNIAHAVTVKLNGSVIGNAAFPAFDRKEWTATVPLSLLVEGTNTITLQSTNTVSDYSVTEAFRINYPRRLKAVNDKLEFTHNSNQSVKLRGFSNPVVRVFDVTNRAQVTETIQESQLDPDGTYSVTVNGTSTPKLLIAQADSVQRLSADPLVPNVASDLRNPLNEGRLIVISQRSMIKALYGLRGVREAEGIRTMLVDVDDIYDEFNDGIKSAEAIRSFLQFAKTNWAVKPDYVIFAGDSSCDPRNYSGMAGDDFNRIPTMFTDTWNIEAPTDEMMVDFNGDDIGEIAVGRLPAQDAEELIAMAEKITNFEPVSLQEANARGIHFVSDDYIGYNFALASRNIASRIPGSVSVNYIDRTTQDPVVLRADIVSRINAGAVLLNFFGHGSVTSWTSGGILRNADASSLGNIKRPTFIVALACLNGDNTVFGVTGFAEAMMKRQHGGAFAVWAASAWNGAYEEEFMGRDLYQRVFAGMPLGDAAREVKSLYPTVDMRRTFIFFGDPSLRLVIPAN